MIHCYIRKFNMALSLYGVLRVTFYFYEDFLKATVKKSAVAKVLQPFGTGVQLIVFYITIKAQLSCFLHLSLVNLPLLVSLDKRFTYRKLDCFFKVRDKELDILEGNDLVDKITRNIFTLFQKPTVLSAEKVLSYF